MKLASVLIACAACSSSPHPTDPDAQIAQPDGAMPDGSVVAAHSGGWRMTGRDATRSYRSDATGPGTAAAMTVFYEHPASTDDFIGLGSPIIDEAGNLYLTSYTPMQPTEMMSLSPAGAVRWHVPLDTGAGIYDTTLGPDGNLYAVQQKGSLDTGESKVISFDAATGAAGPSSPPIAGLARILMPADGAIYALTYTTAAGYGFQVLPSPTATPRWTRPKSGDAYAIAPGGATLLMIDVGSGNPAPPLDLVALDTATGDQRWHHTFDATLTSSPTIAVDTDGTVYVATSKNGSDLHVVKLSPTGDVAWDHVETGLEYPSKILIGSNTVTIACQDNLNDAGITLAKSDGNPPANEVIPCGEPQAIDSHDTIYWSCDGGVQATDTLGHATANWPGRFTFQVILSKAGAVYEVPAAYFADHQLMQIK